MIKQVGSTHLHIRHPVWEDIPDILPQLGDMSTELAIWLESKQLAKNNQDLQNMNIEAIQTNQDYRELVYRCYAAGQRGYSNPLISETLEPTQLGWELAQISHSVLEVIEGTRYQRNNDTGQDLPSIYNTKEWLSVMRSS